MRLQINRGRQPQEGETRICKAYLWLPKRIGDEWRWLETATWRQEYRALHVLVPERNCLNSWTTLHWVDTEWISV